MSRLRLGTITAAFTCTASLLATKAHAEPAPIVFFDIAGPNLAAQSAFYRDVFGWSSAAGGTLTVPVRGPVMPGALRQDPANKVIYIGVSDVSAALAQVVAHGGGIVAPRFEVKGVAVIGLFTDPAGNGMGLVELASNGKAKIP